MIGWKSVRDKIDVRDFEIFEIFDKKIGLGVLRWERDW